MAEVVGAPSKNPDNVKEEEGEEHVESEVTLTEEQLLEALAKLGKYRITPVTDGGPPPIPNAASTPMHKFSFVGTSQTHPPDHSGHGTSMYGGNSQYIPKVPQFSGEEPPLKGDVSYAEWRYEIRCLNRDSDITSSTLVQAIRRSLRGIARRTLLTVGDKASPVEILGKLDSLFGDISTHGMLMQEFF
ncbi:hypothetical protein CI610_02587 [invertebrate metagenome]|uniref:Uncharacterized protein n=1 Tax=invertebrate metagenome TaxID=1711999 RepID=A0A2H9T5I6_9ZZZZ